MVGEDKEEDAGERKTGHKSNVTRGGRLMKVAGRHKHSVAPLAVAMRIPHRGSERVPPRPMHSGLSIALSTSRLQAFGVPGNKGKSTVKGYQPGFLRVLREAAPLPCRLIVS